MHRPASLDLLVKGFRFPVLGLFQKKLFMKGQQKYKFGVEINLEIVKQSSIGFEF